MKKLISSLIVALAIVIMPNVQVNAAGVGSTINDTFPDSVMAQTVANKIASGDVNYVITSTDITNAVDWSAGFSSKGINSIEGIEYFSNLANLRLDNNNLTSLPTNIGNLTSLQSLFLNNNKLASIPDSIGNLSSLSVLHLGSNKLTTLPDSIRNLSNLSDLYLYINLFTSVPEAITSISSLNLLHLNDNQLTSLPDSIGNLTNLRGLLIYNNQLTSLPDTIGNLSSLRDLYSYNNQLTTLPNTIGNLSSLVYFYIDRNKLTSLPDSFGNLTNLQTLFLRTNQLTSLPSSMANLTNITNITLDNQQVKFGERLYTNSLKLVDPIQGFGANQINFPAINNNGVVQGNDIVWDNLIDTQQVLSFTFSQQVTIGSMTTQFSGFGSLNVIPTTPINTLDVTPVDNVTYSGAAYTPVPVVKDGIKELVLGTDFEASYENNINAGTATIHIKGIGMYSGTADVTFTINKATPTVNELPTASIVNKGDKLEESLLSDGSMKGVTLPTKSVESVDGTFSWIAPTSIVNEAKEHKVLFTSSDSNYKNATLSVNVTLENDLPITGIDNTLLFTVIFTLLSASTILVIRKKIDTTY